MGSRNCFRCYCLNKERMNSALTLHSSGRRKRRKSIHILLALLQVLAMLTETGFLLLNWKFLRCVEARNMDFPEKKGTGRNFWREVRAVLAFFFFLPKKGEKKNDLSQREEK